MQQMNFFIADLTVFSTCFGHHNSHHQELESMVQVVAACRIWCLVFKLSVYCGVEGCVSGLRAAHIRLWTFVQTDRLKLRITSVFPGYIHNSTNVFNHS
jgi:hypothetical protein